MDIIHFSFSKMTVKTYVTQIIIRGRVVIYHNHQNKNKIPQVPKFEIYFNIIPETLWTTLIKFRGAKHYLPIETGCWNNVLDV